METGPVVFGGDRIDEAGVSSAEPDRVDAQVAALAEAHHQLGDWVADIGAEVSGLRARLAQVEAEMGAE